MNPPDHSIASRLFNNLGNAARAEGDYRSAIAAYTRSGAEAKESGDRVGQLTAEHNIGLVYTQQNDPARALRHLRRALAMEPRAMSARTLLSISEAERALGRTSDAARDLRRARAATTDGVTLATILLRGGDLRIGRHDLRGAERDFERALEAGRSDPATFATVLAYQARLRLVQHRYRDAADLGVDAAQRAIAADTIALASTIAGQAFRALHESANAIRAFERAIDAVEQERARVAGGAESRERLFEAKTNPYVGIIEVLADAGQNERALEYAERAKARVIVDALRGRVGMPAPVTAGELAATLPHEDDAIVEFVAGNSRLYAFVVTRSGVKLVSTPVSRNELAALCSRFAHELAARNLAFRSTARRLWNVLIAPEWPLLRMKTRICIVPDQELWRVPFQALVDDREQYLEDSAVVFYVPSIAVLRGARVRDGDNSLLAVANGSIAEARNEVQRIARIYGGRTRVDIGAREESVKDEAPHFGVVHFATHGVFDNASPLSSHLLFARGGGEDGRLEAREMMSLPLHAHLVVLSACETASGRPAPGEGMIGMAWALFVAGCPTMVASEWKVESSSTTAMMVAMHRNLVERHMPVADALRAAQLEVRAKFEHPFYWASFVVLGRGW